MKWAIGIAIVLFGALVVCVGRVEVVAVVLIFVFGLLDRRRDG